MYLESYKKYPPANWRAFVFSRVKRRLGPFEYPTPFIAEKGLCKLELYKVVMYKCRNHLLFLVEMICTPEPSVKLVHILY